MPYGDNTHFLDLAFIGVRAVPFCTLAAAHPGDAGLKKKFFFFKNLRVSRSQQRPLGEGGGSLEGLRPDWGTIWVALEWNTIPSGAGQERVRVHALENFLGQRPRFLSLGFGLGGYDTECSFSWGDTPASAGGDQTNKGWFFFPATQKAEMANERNESLSCGPPPPNHPHLEIQI